MKSPIVYYAGFVVLIFVLGLSGQWVNPWLSWNRYGLNDFELWRLITGHMVHTNLWHTFINLSVLSAAMLLFGRLYKPQEWILIFLLLCVCDSMGLYLLSPWLANYVGLSGVIYGILAIGFLKNFYQNPLLNSAVLIFITGKIIWEQMPGFDVDYLRTQIKAAVIVDAHLYGFISGICFYLGTMVWNKYNVGKPGK